MKDIQTDTPESSFSRSPALLLSCSKRQRHRGAAMAETVLTLPFILVLLLMILFYGWSMTRLQRASVQDRYEVWRMANYAYGPGARGQKPDSWPSHSGTSQMNDTFWNGAADHMAIASGRAYPSETRDLIKDEAARASRDTGLLATTMLDDYLPKGLSIGFETKHNLNSDLLQSDAIAGPIKHSHVRIGNEWKYVNAVRLRGDGQWIESQPIAGLDTNGNTYRRGPQTPGRTIRDTFLEELDQALDNVDDGTYGGLARHIRRYYNGFPGYRGPDVDHQYNVTGPVNP